MFGDNSSISINFEKVVSVGNSLRVTVKRLLDGKVCSLETMGAKFG